jgi:hypothetical protein
MGFAPKYERNTCTFDHKRANRRGGKVPKSWDTRGGLTLNCMSCKWL